MAAPKTAAPEVSLDALNDEQVATLLAQLKAREQATVDAEQAARDAQKNVILPAVTTLVKGFPSRAFKAREDGTQNHGWQVPVSIEHNGQKITGQLLLTIKK